MLKPKSRSLRSGGRLTITCQRSSRSVGSGEKAGSAVCEEFFRNQGRFPRTASEIEPLFVAEIAEQLAIAAPSGFAPGLAGRTAERHRAEIRALAGFREASVADAALLEDLHRLECGTR